MKDELKVTESNTDLKKKSREMKVAESNIDFKKSRDECYCLFSGAK